MKSLFFYLSLFRLKTNDHGLIELFDAQSKSEELRIIIKSALKYSRKSEVDTIDSLISELCFLNINYFFLAPIFKRLRSRRVLYVGHCYYNCWYLSRQLRLLGWQADLVNWDQNPSTQIYYHGEDFNLKGVEGIELVKDLNFYIDSIYKYDLFHFSNVNGICFGFNLLGIVERFLEEHAEIFLLKKLGKKILYNNTGCLDGVSQTSFAKWGPESICAICKWRDVPSVCNDEKNLSWGLFRNSVADYQCALGGNRVDFNAVPTAHEVPQFFCLDQDLWNPRLEIPPQFVLPGGQEGLVRLYHAVGHKESRTDENGVNIKSTHVYKPLVEKLRSEGQYIELLEPTGVPNKEVRYIQAQADIFLEMLTYGWFGANAREAMMLGKPVICFLRPEWLDEVRREIPDYVDELPIVSATPQTVEAILRRLIVNPNERQEIGRKSREFALKWHSAEAGGARFEQIYVELLKDNPQLLDYYR